MLCCLLCVFIIGTRNVIIDWFLSSISANERMILSSSLLFGLGNAVIYKYLEGIRLTIIGALSSAADTFFLLIGGTFSIWFLWFFPFYGFVVRQKGSIEMALGYAPSILYWPQLYTLAFL